MRLFYIIFLSTFLVLAIGVGVFGYWLVNSGNNDRKTAIESELGKISKLLSGQLSSVMKDGTSDTDRIDKTLENLQHKISGINKETGEFNAFVTDKKGNVLYDSANKDNIGKDFNLKPEVLAALDGGKIWSGSMPDDSGSMSSEKYSLGVPVRNEERIFGVVSVSKSLGGSENVIRITKENIIIMVGTLFSISLITAIFISYLLTRPVRGLVNYAQEVTGGENARPPIVSVFYFKEMCAVFEEMRIALQKTERIKNYVSEVVHALKTPLTTIKAAAEILKDEIPEDKGRLFSHIESETDRASKSLDDLLELVKAEGQRELKDKRKFSIKELIEESLRSFEPVITRKKIQVKYEPGSYEPVITGDEKMIRRTLEELINNAIDFSPVEAKVVIETRGDKNKVEMFIRDQGPGIPDYAKEKIFNMFYSLKRPDGRKSSGLGLAFAKEIILLHNGEIRLEPSSGEMCGANFRISFIRS
jgi:two-component system, OmpR family, sensor histidine kinase CreC